MNDHFGDNAGGNFGEDPIDLGQNPIQGPIGDPSQSPIQSPIGDPGDAPAPPPPGESSDGNLPVSPESDALPDDGTPLPEEPSAPQNADQILTELDLDGDGDIDAWVFEDASGALFTALDLDNDLKPDAVIVDVDADGAPELSFEQADGGYLVTKYEGGQPSQSATLTPAEIDEVFPGLSTMLPSLGDDGTAPQDAPAPADRIQRVDGDGDGNTDAWVIEGSDGSLLMALNLEGDINPDMVVADINGDGVPEFTFVPTADGYVLTQYEGGEPVGTETLSEADVAANFPAVLTLMQGDAAPGNPVTPDPEQPIGEAPVADPGGTPFGPGDAPDDAPTPFTAEGAAEFWFKQTWNASCLPSSVAGILSVYTGHQYTDQDFVQLVDFSAIGDEGSGLPFPDAERLLEAAGIPATLDQGVSIQEVDTLLENGYGAIVFVDAQENWFQPGERGADTFDNEQEPNHAVMVTEIDMENRMVYLNDSGWPDGQSFAVPLDTFLDAWADSGNAVIRCDVSIDEYRAQTGVDPTAEATYTPETPVEQLTAQLVKNRWLILPVLIGGAALVRAASKK